jgi:hypothetical protein
MDGRCSFSFSTDTPDIKPGMAAAALASAAGTPAVKPKMAASAVLASVPGTPAVKPGMAASALGTPAVKPLIAVLACASGQNTILQLCRSVMETSSSFYLK